MNKTTLAISISMTFIFATSSSMAERTPEQLESMSFADLCAEQRAEPTKRIGAELMRRGLTLGDLAGVLYKRVDIGMSERVARCALGPPTNVNTTTTANGTRKQLVYDPSSQPGETRYLYITDGEVTAIQN